MIYLLAKGDKTISKAYHQKKMVSDEKPIINLIMYIKL